MKVTTCLNPACTSRSTNPIAWQASDLLRPGAGMSMTVGRDGLPLLTYAWDTGLVVARCVNIFCTGVTTRFHDDPSWGVHGVWETAIAVGADGLGLISYYDAWALRVMTVHCADVACGSAFLDMVQTIPAANPSVAVGADGLPVIAFGTNKQYLVRCRDAVCTRF